MLPSLLHDGRRGRALELRLVLGRVHAADLGEAHLPVHRSDAHEPDERRDEHGDGDCASDHLRRVRRNAGCSCRGGRYLGRFDLRGVLTEINTRRVVPRSVVVRLIWWSRMPATLAPVGMCPTMPVASASRVQRAFPRAGLLRQVSDADVFDLSLDL